MKVTENLASRPEYQAWVRQLEIDGRHWALEIIRKGYIPKNYARDLRLYMQEQQYMFFQLAF